MTCISTIILLVSKLMIVATYTEDNDVHKQDCQVVTGNSPKQCVITTLLW